MAVLSLCWLGAAALLEVEQKAPLSGLWGGYGDPLAWLVLLWPALGQYSTGEAAQVAGQAKCAPWPLIHPSCLQQQVTVCLCSSWRSVCSRALRERCMAAHWMQAALCARRHDLDMYLKPSRACPQSYL